MRRLANERVCIKKQACDESLYSEGGTLVSRQQGIEKELEVGKWIGVRVLLLRTNGIIISISYKKWRLCILRRPKEISVHSEARERLG